MWALVPIDHVPDELLNERIEYLTRKIGAFGELTPEALQGVLMEVKVDLANGEATNAT